MADTSILPFMDYAFVDTKVLGVQVSIYGWKVWGLVGGLMFISRWVVQAWWRKRTGSREIPTVFWVISLVGAGMTTVYFTIGKTDMVGILQNAGPAAIAAWNLWKDLSGGKAAAAGGS